MCVTHNYTNDPNIDDRFIGDLLLDIELPISDRIDLVRYDILLLIYISSILKDTATTIPMRNHIQKEILHNLYVDVLSSRSCIHTGFTNDNTIMDNIDKGYTPINIIDANPSDIISTTTYMNVASRARLMPWNNTSYEYPILHTSVDMNIAVNTMKLIAA